MVINEMQKQQRVNEEQQQVVEEQQQVIVALTGRLDTVEQQLAAVPADLGR